MRKSVAMVKDVDLLHQLEVEAPVEEVGQHAGGAEELVDAGVELKTTFCASHSM